MSHLFPWYHPGNQTTHIRTKVLRVDWKPKSHNITIFAKYYAVGYKDKAFNFYGMRRDRTAFAKSDSIYPVCNAYAVDPHRIYIGSSGELCSGLWVPIDVLSGQLGAESLGGNSSEDIQWARDICPHTPRDVARFVSRRLITSQLMSSTEGQNTLVVRFYQSRTAVGLDHFFFDSYTTIVHPAAVRTAWRVVQLEI